ncbi:DUF4352 domain-containing protein [Clostridium estertheticum]|uniref:DUF4352 domain-containing protein n=1 Tax=Clostridium estertheticum subsp. estertheticum TaxID=1552 RepID=A0A1J0GH53_9CLOT|nr:DUF4352 domain-containing protein [Clostridium estertheticum]APC40230.1 hypothetical protein A7L45_09205 [Clostridium estertheticum subsp. estertheticum]MBU3170463.1 DUF4352 domain-containing protein [Clostridium estertheticum]MBU3186960.1 DUF4352 domain-containing protein [Clostridium estertheticum]MBZ9617972.1 DUF4352 domain-containing protein [Clostridium estertheticum subsp. laramiense]WAG73632.1 DUF4352 domain-containing protein [Clostridium estertheticum]
MNKNNCIIISSVVAIVVIAGGFTMDNIIGSNRIKKSESTHVASVLVPTAKDFYKVGDTVKINDISLKIDKIHTANGNKANRPDAGLEYLIVTITVKNESNRNRSYGDDFQMQDDKGKISDPIVTMMANNHIFKGGNLAPKGEFTGTLTFLTVKDAKGLSLNYNWDTLRHKIVRFKLN